MSTFEKLKKFKKTFKKGLDKAEGVWYNVKVAAEAGAKWSLKIEQQREVQSKEKQSKYGSRQRVYILKQSNEKLRKKARVKIGT